MAEKVGDSGDGSSPHETRTDDESGGLISETRTDGDEAHGHQRPQHLRGMQQSSCVDNNAAFGQIASTIVE